MGGISIDQTRRLSWKCTVAQTAVRNTPATVYKVRLQQHGGCQTTCKVMSRSPLVMIGITLPNQAWEKLLQPTHKGALQLIAQQPMTPALQCQQKHRLWTSWHTAQCLAAMLALQVQPAAMSAHICESSSTASSSCCKCMQTPACTMQPLDHHWRPQQQAWSSSQVYGARQTCRPN
jgi:hypothetical protein